MSATQEVPWTSRTAAGRRLALSVDEAAAALGISRDSFERHVMAQVSLLRIGRRLLVPTSELERWIDREMAIPLIAELSTNGTSRMPERGSLAQ
jgi:excisionase family DNA binding protein